MDVAGKSGFMETLHLFYLWRKGGRRRRRIRRKEIKKAEKRERDCVAIFLLILSVALKLGVF